jgi:hypothetical protein
MSAIFVIQPTFLSQRVHEQLSSIHKVGWYPRLIGLEKLLLHRLPPIRVRSWKLLDKVDTFANRSQ